jgi:ribosomal protein S27AE
MADYNRDYRKELREGQPIKAIVDRFCPKCSGRLIALPPDRAWCENSECNYGEMHLVGNGVHEQQLEIYGESTER